MISSWPYIDMNDGKLLDDLKTFDGLDTVPAASPSVRSYPRMTYPSLEFHATVFALGGARRLRVDISRSININTLTSRLCVTLSTPSQRTGSIT